MDVRFDRFEQLKGRERVERYCLAVIAGERRTAVLVVDPERSP